MFHFVKRVPFLVSALAITIAGFVIVTGLTKTTPVASPTPTLSVATTTDSLAYSGEEGKDALTVLKSKAQVEQDSSGLVTTINGRKADSGAHEYWSFYVNGKLAEVGPANYILKSSDQVEWKIEKY
jgi:hypothetical protein